MRVWTLISILFLIVLSLWVYPCEGDSTEVCPASGDGSESVGCGGSDSSIIDESDKTAHGNEEGSEQSGEVVNEEVQHIIPKGANAEGKPLDVSFDDCQDRHPEKCQAWSGAGECDNNPGWMTVNCPLSCNRCDLRDPKVRCDRARLNIATEPIYKSGDLDDMFSHIEEDFGDRYGVTIVSRDPWIVTFDNFVSDEEVTAIIESVEGHWERSTDTGQTNAFGETGRVLSSSRTSINAWCRYRCENDPHVQRVSQKIAEITRIPTENYESFQILQYEVGQYYRPHHDSSERQKYLACGHRILTFFLYLSDVEEGGETAFPTLGISVAPKKGKALLWTSIMSDDPMEIDERTIHEARPVLKGKKFAANAWIHLYNFKQSNLWGCTGAFDQI